jgi:hypothetical protein
VQLPPFVLAELGAEVVGEQAVVAEPAPLGVERDEEQVGPLRPVEQRVGVASTGQLAAQLDGEPLRDRSLDQERAQVLVDLGEDLVCEVIEDEALAAAKRPDQPSRSGRSRREMAAS